MVILKLREVRQSQSVTQMELSSRTGIKQAIISRMEKGITIPRIDQLQLFMVALNVKWEDLVEVQE